METSIEGTWVGQTSAGTVVARIDRDQELSRLDRPGLGRFHEPWHGTVHDGHPVVDDTVLHRVVGVRPELVPRFGWYDGRTRSVLLTHIAEPSLGEPMVFLAEGDRVVRAYPVSDTQILGENGTVVDIGSQSLRLTADGAETMLTRSSRYREREVTFDCAGARLAATLITPDTPGPHPAAIVVHAAAGGDRHFYRLFAGPILDAGVAVLLYDKPGHGRSAGPADPTIFDQADAVSAGIDLLASLPDVDRNRTGLWGVSNGMWAVPRVAGRRHVAAFVAGIGAPGVSMSESEVHRRTTVLAAAGLGPSTVAAAGEAWRCLFEIAATGTTTDLLTSRLEAAMRALAAATDLHTYEVPGYAGENPMLSPLPPPAPVDELIALVSGNPDPQLTYDPVADYAQFRCPVLLQYGADDSNVPTRESVRRIEAALNHAGAPVSIRVYPGLEHLLNAIPADVAGLTAEAAMHGFHGFRFGHGVREELTQWLRDVTAVVPAVPEVA